MNISLVTRKGQTYTDSREVAATVEKEHHNLVRDIRGYVADMGSNQPVCTTKSEMIWLNINDFFILDEYVDARECIRHNIQTIYERKL